jgi:hypothetical protein
MAVNVVGLFMALLSFVETAPRAYRLKASNAAPPFFNIRRDISAQSGKRSSFGLQRRDRGTATWTELSTQQDRRSCQVEPLLFEGLIAPS